MIFKYTFMEIIRNLNYIILDQIFHNIPQTYSRSLKKLNTFKLINKQINKSEQMLIRSQEIW